MTKRATKSGIDSTFRGRAPRTPTPATVKATNAGMTILREGSGRSDVLNFIKEHGGTVDTSMIVEEFGPKARGAIQKLITGQHLEVVGTARTKSKAEVTVKRIDNVKAAPATEGYELITLILPANVHNNMVVDYTGVINAAATKGDTGLLNRAAEILFAITSGVRSQGHV